MEFTAILRHTGENSFILTVPKYIILMNKAEYGDILTLNVVRLSRPIKTPQIAQEVPLNSIELPIIDVRNAIQNQNETGTAPPDSAQGPIKFIDPTEDYEANK